MTTMRFLANALRAITTASVIALASTLPAVASVTTTCSTAGGTNCMSRIPDAVGPVAGTITSTMTVAACPAGASSAGVSASLKISHTWVGDLQVTLTNPNATTVTLLSNLADPTGSPAGCQGDNVNATFVDGAPAQSCSAGLAGNVAPATSMAAFGQAPINGVWTLTVSDTQNSSDGILNDWSIVAICQTLDIDANKVIDGLTDGLMVLRYLFGITGSGLTANAIGPNATRTDPAVIKTYLDGIKPMLDIDLNGNVDALTDGILILRYILGIRGDGLIAGAVGPGAMRNTAALIEAYMATLTQ